MPLVKTHPFAIDRRAGLAPKGERRIVAAELDADLLQNPIGLSLDEVEAFLAHQDIRGDLTPDTGDDRGRRASRLLAPG